MKWISLVMLILVGCTEGGLPLEHDELIRLGFVKKACLEGHAYWQTGRPGGYYFNFAPIITDSGLPVRCKTVTQAEFNTISAVAAEVVPAK